MRIIFFLIICSLIYAWSIAVQFSQKQANILGIATDSQSSTDKQFLGGPFFGFLDPLNHQSYKSAVKYAKKFDYLCPKIFQIFTLHGSNKIMVRNNASKAPNQIPTQGQFIISLKRQNPSIKITPVMSFNLNQMKPQKVIDLFQDPQLLFPELNVHLQPYDGIVLDFGSFIHPTTRPHLYHFLSFISRKFQEDKTSKIKKQVIVTAYIPKSQKIEQKIEHLDTLAEFISKGQAKYSRFVIFAYDYSIDSQNSPIFWVEDTLQYFLGSGGRLISNDNSSYINPKLIIVFPFFGKCFSGEKKEMERKSFNPFVELIKMKENNQNIAFQWNKLAQEHSVILDHKSCTVPTKQFLTKRIQLAQKYQVGIGIQQIGQGFEEQLRFF